MVPLILLALALSVAWIVSEFYGRRWPRLLLGICALLSSLGAAFLVGRLEQHFSANAYYGLASKDLVDTAVAELEKGNTLKVAAELKRLQQQFHPTYENRARYDNLVEEFVRRVKSGEPGRGRE